MSLIELFTQLPKLDCLKTTEKLVLLCLKWHCGKNGHCWPSIKTLCSEISAERKAVFRALRRLEDLGFIKRGKRGKNNNTFTVLVVPKTGTTQNGDIPELVTSPSPKGEQLEYQNGDDLNKSKLNKKEKNKKAPQNTVAQITEEFATKQAESVDLVKFRKEFPHRNVDQEHSAFMLWYFEGLDNKGRPHWKKWEWKRPNTIFRNWMNKPWKQDKPTERQEVTPEPDHPLWPEIQALRSYDFQVLRQEAIPYARKKSQCGDKRDPPEALTRDYMIKIYEAEKGNQ